MMVWRLEMIVKRHQNLLVGLLSKWGWNERDLVKAGITRNSLLLLLLFISRFQFLLSYQVNSIIYVLGLAIFLFYHNSFYCIIK